MISFTHTWVFWLLPLPIVAWFLLKPRVAPGAVLLPLSISRFVSSLDRPSTLSVTGTVLQRSARIVGWIALITALSGPFVPTKPTLSPSGRDLLIAIDLSASMGQRLELYNPEAGRPIDILNAVVKDFIAGRQGDRIGLVGFASEAFLVAPFTFDTQATMGMLEEVSIGLPGRRTDLGRAIGLAIQVFRVEPPGQRALILVSDGESNAGDLAALDAAKLAANLGVTIHTIGFGSEVESESAAHMAEVSAITGGRYFEAKSKETLKAVKEKIDALLPTTRDERPRLERHDLTWIPLVIVLLSLGWIAWREVRRT